MRLGRMSGSAIVGTARAERKQRRRLSRMKGRWIILRPCWVVSLVMRGGGMLRPLCRTEQGQGGYQGLEMTGLILVGLGHYGLMISRPHQTNAYVVRNASSGQTFQPRPKTSCPSFGMTKLLQRARHFEALPTHPTSGNLPVCSLLVTEDARLHISGRKNEAILNSCDDCGCNSRLLER